MNVRSIHKDLSPNKKPSIKKKSLKKLENISQKNLSYFFLTAGIIICLFQAIRGASINVLNYINLKHKLHQLQSLNVEAKERNDQLKEQLKSYTSSKGVEALARDTLKMVGKNEILVLINDAPPSTKQKQ